MRMSEHELISAISHLLDIVHDVEEICITVRISPQTFDDLCAAGASEEDMESDGDFEAEETVDGWSA